MKASALARLVVLPLAVLALGPALFTGCDDNDSGLTGSEFRVEPGSVKLYAADSTVVLHAVGGQEPLKWTVTDEALGKVSGGGRTVTYTRTAATGANTVRVADIQTWTAKSVISQEAGEAPVEEEEQPLAISPTSVTLNENGDRAVFSGAGGRGPYVWDVGNGARGHLKVDGWSQAVYTRDAAGNNTVIVHDQHGHAAIASVTQPNSGGALSVSVTPSTTLQHDGDKCVLNASGGSPPYSWSVLDAALGHLTGDTTDDSVVYVRDHAGDNVVRLRDSAGRVINTIIVQP